MNQDDKTIHLSQQDYINLMAHKITHDVVAETRIDIDRLRDEMVEKFEKIDSRFEKTDARIEKLEDKIDSNFKWVIGLVLISVLSPIILHFI